MGSLALLQPSAARASASRLVAQTADVVMLIMNAKGIDHLLSDKFTIWW
jgi:hypothetical protein